MSAISVASPTADATVGRVDPRYRVRWDRVAALAAAVVIVIAGSTAIGVGPSQADPVPAPAIHVVVDHEDTLWDLAARHAPSGVHTMTYATRIAQHNDVRAGQLRPGSLLELPRD